MSTAAALPTRRDEAWRYADLATLARLWPERATRTRRLAGAALVLDERIAGSGWHDEALTIEVAPGGRLEGVIEQAMVSDGVATLAVTIELGAGATAGLTLVNRGGDYGRLALDVRLHEGASFEMGGAIVGGGGQTLEIVTVVRHLGAGAFSRQVVRAALGGQATGSYLGQVAVARGAQKTDAAQDFKALLLGRGATANAKPELEIFADDVKCAHGASVGALDRHALFYLQSRGLTPTMAEALLAQAFVDDAIAGLGEGPVREGLLQALAGLVAAR